MSPNLTYMFVKKGITDSFGLKFTGWKEAEITLILLKGSWGGQFFRHQAEKGIGAPWPWSLSWKHLTSSPGLCLHTENKMLLTMQQATKAP